MRAFEINELKIIKKVSIRKNLRTIFSKLQNYEDKV